MSDLDVIVVGGGISGLAIAHRLAHSGLSVEVWEGAERVGGKIQTVMKQGYQLESAASMVMNFRSEVDQFLRSAGLESSKRGRTPTAKRYVLDTGRLHAVPSDLIDLFKSPLFSTAGKLRLLAEPLVPRSRNPHENVAQFVTRRLGREFLEKVFEPYVTGPLASNVNRAEACTTMPRLTALEQRFGSLALGVFLRKLTCRGSAGRPEAFSFAGGMGTLTEKLATQGGFRVRNNLQVSEMWPVSGGWMTRGTAGNTPYRRFSRQLVVSTPADTAAVMVDGLDAELARQLRAIEYAPVNVVHTGFSRAKIGHPLNGSGFLVPRRSNFTPNGCLWMSSLFPDHAPQGHVLLSSYIGGARNPAAASWGATRSLDTVMHMLGALLGIKADPDMLHIETHTHALPLYHDAYSQKLEVIEQRLQKLPGFYLEANYRGGVSVRDRILRAELVAGNILKQQNKMSRARAFTHKPGIGANISPASATIV